MGAESPNQQKDATASKGPTTLVSSSIAFLQISRTVPLPQRGATTLVFVNLLGVSSCILCGTLKP